MADFEEQALSSVPTAPKIWKRYVDDTFTILYQGPRSKVKNFLKHLHTQQPTISFTMETENDNTIPFLDTLVIKDSEGRLTTSAYKKPTLISTCLMTHTTLNESDELNAVLSSAYTIDRKISSLNHRLPLRKRSI
ncbi:unnamed protein product [Porites evermanni]|uniref:Reverse transcriptase domain-containing protein n=1 Tax=Porites evermanni TaxID=104178 RepID=A0ABN8PMX7_9CNID|nr:unnamed protein product [Porites evermanni]